MLLGYVNSREYQLQYLQNTLYQYNSLSTVKVQYCNFVTSYQLYNFIPAKHFSNAHYTTTPSTVLQNISNYNCDKIVSLCFILNSEKILLFYLLLKAVQSVYTV